MNLNTNPFVYGKTVTGKDFVNRKQERNELVNEIENHTNIIMYAPRRYGKTSLILQVYDDLKRKNKKFAGMIIDFYQVNTIKKFIVLLTNQYMKQSGFTLERIMSFLKNTLKGITPVLTVDDKGYPKIEMDISPSRSTSVLENALELPKKLADSGKLVSVFFDEFQEISSLNGNSFQKKLRSIIQHHNNVSYIFAGSKYHLFEKIFIIPAAPLYKSGKTKHLDELPENEIISFVFKHLKKIHPLFTKKDAEEIFSISGSIPYNVQMLSNEVFNLALLNHNQLPKHIISQALTNILYDKNEEFLMTYDRLNTSSTIVLEIILNTEGKGLFRKENLSQYQMAPSTVKKALNSLQEKSIIEKRNNKYIFQDVFFELWLKERV